jgi:hypothetical protein
MGQFVGLPVEVNLCLVFILKLFPHFVLLFDQIDQKQWT